MSEETNNTGVTKTNNSLPGKAVLDEFDPVKLAMNVAFRQVGPVIRNLFEGFADVMEENIYMVFIAAYYKPGYDLNSHESIEMCIQSIVNKDKKLVIVYDQNPEIHELYTFIPLMAENLQKQCEEWSVSLYDVFLMFNYISGKDMADPMASLKVQLKTFPRAGVTRSINFVN